jgi:GST-like protein
MIELYTAATPNGQKANICLEELGLEYEVHAMDLKNNDQKRPEFLAINPNGRIPAIVDAGRSVFESGAILFHLAEKHGQLLPASGNGRKETMEWLMFQMGGLGPMAGQMSHFIKYAPVRVEYGLERYTNETHRLLSVLEGRLDGREYLAAGEYTIADIATYPWLRYLCQLDESCRDKYPHISQYVDRIGAREAVQRGLKVPS